MASAQFARQHNARSAKGALRSDNRERKRQRSYLDRLRVGLADVPHCRARDGRLERRVVAVGLRQAVLVLGNVGIDPRLRRSAGEVAVHDVLLRSSLRRRLSVHLSLLLHLEHLDELCLNVVCRSLCISESFSRRHDPLARIVALLLKLVRRGLVHGQLADGGHHFSGHVFDARLEGVDLLRELHRALSSVDGLVSQFLRKGGDLLKDQLFFEQALFLVVQPFFQILNLDSQRLLVEILALELAPLPQRALRVLKLPGQFVGALPDASHLLS
mmetsp:Transcript_117410/g.339443  ORF Transcript_117410/g.339443 Transcript_117410/m.339443 type:complete len:272 (-) Transcript_117410:2198-3013(-)